MFYHIFKQYLELPKWLYTRIHCSVDCIVVTLLYCTTLYVSPIWLHLTISTSLGMYPKMDKWKIKIMMMFMNKFLFNKTNRHTNFPNLFLSRKSTCFGQFLCPSSGVFHCTFSIGICHAGLITAFKHNQVLSWSCLKAVIKSAWHIPMPNVQWKIPDDGQRNCPKHVEFLTK